MMLTVGNKVIYPCRGPCLINSIITTTVDEKPTTFYELVVLNDCRGTLLVPADKVQTVGIRPLLNQPEISGLLALLERPSTASTDRRQRVRDNLVLFRSGSAFDLAEIVESLTERIETKPLSFGERLTLERAKRLLVCEISEVTGETKQQAEDSVDRALTARTRTRPCAV
jgi:CarD family transcriptional regulator